jgi:hypothetical protein
MSWLVNFYSFLYFFTNNFVNSRKKSQKIDKKQEIVPDNQFPIPQKNIVWDFFLKLSAYSRKNIDFCKFQIFVNTWLISHGTTPLKTRRFRLKSFRVRIGFIFEIESSKRVETESWKSCENLSRWRVFLLYIFKN